MNITIDTQGDRMVIALNGRLDAASGPALEAKLPTDGVRELVLDFTDCPFVSSCGIRAILVANRCMITAGGRVVVRNLPRTVRDIFDMT